ncbi:hypothetical protein V1264_011089 [Littorina saxatilis]|uniref:BHLH domain-containing protein n=1 Tax=Littorina saxatilis TaxID=31220 RepID=A0AAN9BU34_9CAEN
MANQNWSPVSHAQEGSLRLAAIMVPSSSAVAASPLFVHTENKMDAEQQLTSQSRLLSSTLYQTLAANNVVSSSGSPSKHPSGHYTNAQTQFSLYGESGARVALLSSQNQSAMGTVIGSALSGNVTDLSQNFASSVRAASTSPNFDNDRSRSTSFLRVVSPKQQQQQFFNSPGSVSASHQHSLPPSPQKSCASTQAAGSPFSSHCASPDNFLSPSPYSQAANSPTSEYNEGSSDTTENMQMEADSGYSDVPDKSSTTTTPDKAENSDTQSTPNSKRKRVRKSRAKAHDPMQKKVVKRGRRVRANDRERSRMHGLNDAMDELREHIPQDGGAGKMTKIDTLRTAANYIRVLKMLLGDIEKGEDPDMGSWPSDMVAAVNNLYGVQPLASPDSTSVASPSMCEDQCLQQNCGVVSGSLGVVPVSGHFPSPAGFQSEGFGVVDNYTGVGSVHGVMASHQPTNDNFSSHSVLANANVSMLDEDASYSSVQSSVHSAVNNGYNMHGFASTVLNNVYPPQQFSVGQENRSPSNSMLFQQSSQCY